MIDFLRKNFAELLGTFVLTVSVLLSVVTRSANLASFGIFVGLGLSVCVFGAVSGGYFNPALTIAAGAYRLIDLKTTASYVVSQFLGGLLGFVVIDLFATNVSLIEIIKPIAASQQALSAVGFAEAFGAVLFSMVVVYVITSKLSSSVKGALVGAGLFFGSIIASSLGSVGILNPAVSVYVGLFNHMYILGPILGALVGMGIYFMITGRPVGASLKKSAADCSDCNGCEKCMVE